MEKQRAEIRQQVLGYAIMGAIVWTVLMAISLTWNVQRQNEVTFELALNTARSSFNKDQAYRFWASNHGGVYVEPTEKTPPSPWMSHLPDRDITTNDGRLLTLMNPAYMLREMMQDFADLYGVKGRIVGIVYLNPNNKADSWEAQAIKDFAAGKKDEVLEISSIDSQPYLRLIKPMLMSESCQKCHGHLGFNNGEVRGAVGVYVPMQPYLKAEEQVVKGILVSHSAFWLIGLSGIGIIARKTQQRLLERAKAEEEIHLAAYLFANDLDASVITDRNGIILRVNPAFSVITGYNQEDAIGKRPNILRSHHHDNDFYAGMWGDLLSKGSWQGEIWNRRKNGEIFAAWENIVAVKDNKGEIRHFISSFSDITEKMENQQRITHLAHYDVLTGLPNRVLFKDRLEHAISKAIRNNSKIALMFIDLDGFKKINDTMGHRIGDELLKAVASRFSASLRASDTLARIGGDEFTIIIEEVKHSDHAGRVAEKILYTLKQAFVIEGKEIFVNASIGISFYPQDCDNAEALLQHADTAMYHTKAKGKGHYSFYAREMTLKEKKSLEIENALRNALEENQFEAYFQPKQNLKSGEIYGFEALVRWRHPELGIVSPADFIPLAEEMRIIEKIDLLVLEQACIQGKKWLDMGLNIEISSNLSGLDLRSHDLPEKIAVILANTAFPASLLELEITESFVLDLDEAQFAILYALKDMGISLGIDDFGTGYSSLSYLKRLPVSSLKIDRTFIRDMIEDSRDMTLIVTVISLAHSLGLNVIAEGVESQEQADKLRELDCDNIQGYLLSPPVTAGEAEELFKPPPSLLMG